MGNNYRFGKTKPEAERVAQVPLYARISHEIKDRWVSEAKRTNKSVARLLIGRASLQVK
jgi:hypothetical protein